MLRSILIRCTELRFTIDHVRIERQQDRILVDREGADYEGVELERNHRKGAVTLCMQVKGKRPIPHLIARLSDIDGILEVGTINPDTELD